MALGKAVLLHHCGTNEVNCELMDDFTIQLLKDGRAWSRVNVPMPPLSYSSWPFSAWWGNAPSLRYTANEFLCNMWACCIKSAGCARRLWQRALSLGWAVGSLLQFRRLLRLSTCACIERHCDDCYPVSNGNISGVKLFVVLWRSIGY